MIRLLTKGEILGTFHTLLEMMKTRIRLEIQQYSGVGEEILWEVISIRQSAIKTLNSSYCSKG
jgi:hypothetical protein